MTDDDRDGTGRDERTPGADDAGGPGGDVSVEAAGTEPESAADEPPDVAAPEERTREEVEERAAEREEEAELERLQSEFEGLNERHLRLAAEFENYRKRVERERTESWGRAQADLIRRLVDALDDLDRVAGAGEEEADPESLREGIRLVHRKLHKSLDDAGLEVLDPVDERFDPEVMEALMTVPAGDDEEDDTVAEVYQKGYLFRDHLVRPARVVVRQRGAGDAAGDAG